MNEKFKNSNAISYFTYQIDPNEKFDNIRCWLRYGETGVVKKCRSLYSSLECILATSIKFKICILFETTFIFNILYKNICKNEQKNKSLFVIIKY